jgi:Tfp pilus assembly protein PilZ
VAWIVPTANDRNMPTGIGVHLSDSEGSRSLRSRIETLIANAAA